MAGERTEAPTPKRRDDARKKGQVSKSQELVSTGVLLVAVFTMRQLGPDLWANMATIVRDGLSQDATRELTPLLGRSGRRGGGHHQQHEGQGQGVDGGGVATAYRSAERNWRLGV